jgi:hypothetical protein
MFGAVALFIVLLVAMLYLAFVRFRNPPQPRAAPAPVGIHGVGGGQQFAWAFAGEAPRLAAAVVPAAGSGHG